MQDDRPDSSQPWDAFDELGRLVLGDNSLQTGLQRGADLARATVPGADEVSVTLVGKGGATTAAFTGALALDLDESQYERGHGPCLDAAASGEPRRIDDVATETRWPDYVPIAAGRGSQSSLSMSARLTSIRSRTDCSKHFASSNV